MLTARPVFLLIGDFFGEIANILQLWLVLSEFAQWCAKMVNSEFAHWCAKKKAMISILLISTPGVNSAFNLVLGIDCFIKFEKRRRSWSLGRFGTYDFRGFLPKSPQKP